MEQTGKLKKQHIACLKLKEKCTPSYHEKQKLPVHLLVLVAAKLRKLIEQDVLDHVLHSG